NPSNPNQIYLSSYFNGLVKFENDVLSQVYNETNSGLESIFPTDPPTDNLRIEQSVFDRNGNLWMTNGLVKTAIKVLTPSGTWQAFNVEGIIDSYMDTRYGRMLIDKNSTKWICTTKDGIVAFNEN